MKENIKKEIKEILEILAYVAISTAFVFQINSGCSRKNDKQDADDKPVTSGAPVAPSVTAARNALIHNIVGKSR